MPTHIKALPKGTVLQSANACYTIASVAGRGGFGITYIASTPIRIRNIQATATVAIKELFIADDCERTDSQVSASGSAANRFAEARRDFLAEARRLQKLSGINKNIVRVNEVFEANGTAYYVMEYLEGPSLKEYVAKNGPLSQKETLRLMLPIIEATDFLHSRRIMHLDIKPANIVIASTPDGGVLPTLIDFGQSKHYDIDGNATYTVAAAGVSEGYSPVEQYAGIKTFSPSADIYALAASILFCLTGHRPPRSADLTQTTLDSLLPSEIDSNLRAALKKALYMDPAKRLQSVSTFRTLISDKNQRSESAKTANSTPVNEAIVINNKPEIDNGKPHPQKPKKSSRKLLWSSIMIPILTLAAFLILNNRSADMSETSAIDKLADSLSTVKAVKSPETDSVLLDYNESNPFSFCIIAMGENTYPIYQKPDSTSARLCIHCDSVLDDWVVYGWLPHGKNLASLAKDDDPHEPQFENFTTYWEAAPVLEINRNWVKIPLGNDLLVPDTTITEGWVEIKNMKLLQLQPFSEKDLNVRTIHSPKYGEIQIKLHSGPEGWDFYSILVGKRHGKTIVYDKAFSFNFTQDVFKPYTKAGLTLLKTSEGVKPRFGPNLFKDYEILASEISESQLEDLIKNCETLNIPYVEFTVNDKIFGDFLKINK